MKPRLRFLVANFESDVAGILTNDQDFAITAQILCEKPALHLCLQERVKVRKTAFMNGAVIVARIQKGLQLAFRQLLVSRLRYPHQGIPDLPTRSALAIPVVPVPRVRSMIHR